MLKNNYCLYFRYRNMDYRQEDQQQRQQLLNIVDRGTLEELFVS
jgi:hypothetical protein